MIVGETRALVRFIFGRSDCHRGIEVYSHDGFVLGFESPIDSSPYIDEEMDRICWVDVEEHLTKAGIEFETVGLVFEVFGTMVTEYDESYTDCGTEYDSHSWLIEAKARVLTEEEAEMYLPNDDEDRL